MRHRTRRPGCLRRVSKPSHGYCIEEAASTPTGGEGDAIGVQPRYRLVFLLSCWRNPGPIAGLVSRRPFMAQFLAQPVVKQSSGADAGRSGLDLIEEAMHLLRRAPASTLAVYYAGAIPFTIVFLYFWADMSRSPFAVDHLAEASLMMTVLFL